MSELIKTYADLRVYQRAFEAAMRIYDLSRSFPLEEKYSLTDQVRRSSRSVCANLIEAWRKRRYPAAFIAKLNDAESEANETQVWVDFAVRCEYMGSSAGDDLKSEYDRILGQIACMQRNPDKWVARSNH